MTYLGIDFGTKRIGLALATDETPPVPLMTVQSNQSVVVVNSTILDVIRQEHVDVIVVGRPKAMNGVDRKTDIEKETELFVASLTSHISPLISIVFVDERLTSKGADQLRREFGDSSDRDAVAAMLILETYLGQQKK